MVGMPIPSASEMNPSDGALSVFGRVLLGVLAALAVGGALSLGSLMVPGSVADVAGGAGLGALIGVTLGVVVGPATGFLAAGSRDWIRRSMRNAMMAAVGVWVVWVVIAALALTLGLRFPLNLWGNIWPFLPALAVALAAALLPARWVHRSEDPLTPEQARAELLHQRAQRKDRPGADGVRRGRKG